MACLIPIIVWVIVALIVLYVIETLVSPFLAIPPPIMVLIRLLIGLVVLLKCLDCLGLLSGAGKLC